ncbi:hypothetical protein NLJ89_g12010 [Agrocybe chaxingu]|uniref:Uncharacterized protein n=1 Tax=Agrocybe chaxingu TaxID=84603 RepID=A0A9W8MQN0_9AGAR|nr:hypothetical protein NLJ89_g12010 [Agrocybe chaxingu]
MLSPRTSTWIWSSRDHLRLDAFPWLCLKTSSSPLTGVFDIQETVLRLGGALHEGRTRASPAMRPALRVPSRI